MSHEFCISFGLLGNILYFTSHYWLKRIHNVPWLFLFLWNQPKSFPILEWAGETGTSGNPKGEAEGTDTAAQNAARWPGDVCLSGRQLRLPATVRGLGKAAGEQIQRRLLHCLGLPCPFQRSQDSLVQLAHPQPQCWSISKGNFAATWDQSLFTCGNTHAKVF